MSDPFRNYDDWSPMPFGSDPFRDEEVIWKCGGINILSPMPFGSDPFRDSLVMFGSIIRLLSSPMPFGSDPFRDNGECGVECGTVSVVTNAFRQ